MYGPVTFLRYTKAGHAIVEHDKQLPIVNSFVNQKRGKVLPVWVLTGVAYQTSWDVGELTELAEMGEFYTITDAFCGVLRVMSQLRIDSFREAIIDSATRNGTMAEFEEDDDQLIRDADLYGCYDSERSEGR